MMYRQRVAESNSNIGGVWTGSDTSGAPTSLLFEVASELWVQKQVVTILRVKTPAARAGIDTRKVLGLASTISSTWM